MRVEYAEYPYPTDGPRAGFKADVIRRLIESGECGQLVAGVGDRPSDMLAYTRNGLRCMIVKDSLGETGGSREQHWERLLRTEAELRREERAGEGRNNELSVEYWEDR
eukprot:TRINITY_DN50962_c0_g1_i1.p1 TRINITY_DN50962_c0_g1~~TRINITY_DN50962_c0_g1_i1.p1  ORF type:complete len:108 (+),score=20.47 TRINITY_DN50962_c0_g1_i1:153-476(+)